MSLIIPVPIRLSMPCPRSHLLPLPSSMKCRRAMAAPVRSPTQNQSGSGRG
jgi:hypothetical protein